MKHSIVFLIGVFLVFVGLSRLSTNVVLGVVVLLVAGILFLISRRRLSPLGNTRPICPYCNGVLEKMPGAKKKCPHCANYIYVRTRPLDQQKVLVTAEQTERIDEEWAIRDGRHDEYVASKNERKEVKQALKRLDGVTGSDTIPACPYCGVVLEKPPSRKAKCPDCGEYIYVRSRQILFPRHLLTHKEAICADCFKDISTYGLTELDFRTARAELTQQFGCEANVVDTMWHLYNKLIPQCANHYSCRNIYFQMAIFNNKLGRPFFKLLQQAARISLEEMKAKSWMKNVRIECGDGCPVCEPFRNRVLTIDDALKELPVPCEDCEYTLPGGHKGWCMCFYQPVVE